jgi:hypothetical protein
MAFKGFLFVFGDSFGDSLLTIRKEEVINNKGKIEEFHLKFA